MENGSGVNESQNAMKTKRDYASKTSTIVGKSKGWVTVKFIDRQHVKWRTNGVELLRRPPDSFVWELYKLFHSTKPKAFSVANKIFPTIADQSPKKLINLLIINSQGKSDNNNEVIMQLLKTEKVDLLTVSELPYKG